MDAHAPTRHSAHGSYTNNLMHSTSRAGFSSSNKQYSGKQHRAKIRPPTSHPHIVMGSAAPTSTNLLPDDVPVENGQGRIERQCKYFAAELARLFSATAPLPIGEDTSSDAMDMDPIPIPDWIIAVTPMAHAALHGMLPVDGKYQAIFTLSTVAKSLYKSFHTTPEMEQAVREMPQRSAEWMRVRNGWFDLSENVFRPPIISSSLAGPVLKHHKTNRDYVKSHVQLLKEQVWHDFKSDPNAVPDGFTVMALQRGTAMEPTIMAYTRCFWERHVRATLPNAIVTIEEVGLHIDLQNPWMAASPDGIISVYDPDTNTLYCGGLEMKCRVEDKYMPYDIIKDEYYEQIQHTMALLQLPEYTFVCHSANGTSFEIYKFDADAWARHLVAMKEYYWKKLWPRVVLRALGLLDLQESAREVVCGPEDEPVFVKADHRPIHPTLEMLVGSDIGPPTSSRSTPQVHAQALQALHLMCTKEPPQPKQPKTTTSAIYVTASTRPGQVMHTDGRGESADSSANAPDVAWNQVPPLLPGSKPPSFADIVWGQILGNKHVR